MISARWPAHSIFFVTALVAWVFPSLGVPMIVIGFAIFGFQHGALDFTILNKLNRSIPRYVALYIFVMMIYAVAFLRLPVFAMAVFVLLSSYHFGFDAFDVDLHRRGIKKQILLPFLFGFALLSVAAWAHVSESVRITSLILPDLVSNPLSLTASIELFARSAAGLAAAAAILIAAFVSKQRAFTVQVIVLVVSLFILPLEVGFGLFFVYWHSVDSLVEQKLKLHLTAAELVKKSSFLSAGAILTIVGASLLEGPSASWPLNIHSVFMMVGALSVAHILLSPSIKRVRGNLRLSIDPRQPSGSSS